MGVVLMSEPAANRTCRRDRIRDALVTRILDGTYPAGMRLKELTLAREFGVSQAPIREALRELEGSGLVKNERYRGTRVRGADYREIRESYELRGFMEERALQLAAPFSRELAEDLAARTRVMANAIEGHDPEGYIDEALRTIAASSRRAATRRFSPYGTSCIGTCAGVWFCGALRRPTAGG